MQGRLRGETLSVSIETACAHCSAEMRLSASSEMQMAAEPDEVEPLVFLPQVDWQTFTEPNIISAY